MAITFNGTTKIATLGAGTVSVDAREIWSRWVDWVATSDNAKYLPMFRQLGGDDVDLAAGTSVPIYLFLLNGWKVRPQEANHTLNVGGAILLVDGGGDPFANTTGTYNVRINYQQPVQAITVSTGGGGDPWSTLLEAGYTAADVLRTIATATAGKLSGAGTGTETFRSIDDSRDGIIATVDASGNRLAITIDPS